MRWTLSVLLVTLIAAIAWLLGSDGTAEAIHEPTPTPILKEARPPTEVGTYSTTEAPTAPLGKAPARETVEETLKGPSGEVTVLRFGTDEPIEGAEVGYYTDPSFIKELSENDRQAIYRGDIESYRKHAHVRTTNAAGKCQLPMVKPGIQFIAAHEDRYGTSYIRADAPETTIHLRVDRELVITVQDAAGRPAEGVSVYGKRQSSSTSPHGSYWQMGTTDTRGQVTQHHTQNSAGDKVENKITVYASGTGVESQQVEVDLLAERSVALDLTLPRAGTITFELRDETGQPFDLTGHETPTIGITTHDSKPEQRAAFQSINRGGKHPFGEDSRLTVRYVALDKFYAATLRKLLRKPLIGKGPTSSTPDIIIPITISSDMVVFKGRAIDAEGKPIAEKTIYIICKYDGGQAGQTTNTGEDGSFVLPIPYLKPGKVVELTALFQMNVNPKVSYRHPEAWKVLVGTNELGEITCTEPPFLLTGKLIVPPSMESTTRISWQLEVHDQGRWQQHWESQTKWLEERRFEIRGAIAEGKKLRLRFGQGQHRPLEPLEFISGDRDVEIEIASAGSVNASFLVDDLRHQSVIQVRLESEVKTAKSDPHTRIMRQMRNRHRLMQAGEGKLAAAWPGLESGIYELRVLATGAAEPLVTIPGIQVGNGPVEDARLTNIDLRGRFREIEISLNDAQGSPFTQDNAHVYLADEAQWIEQRLQDGKVKVTITDSAKIRVIAKGYKLTRIDNVRSDHVITMESAPKVRFSVKWPFALPEGMEPRLRLTPKLPDTTRKTRVHNGGSSGGIENHVYAEGDIAEDGQAVVQPMFLGKQSVRIVLNHDGRRSYYYPRAARSIEVTGKETGVIEIEINAQRLQERLDRMKKR